MSVPKFWIKGMIPVRTPNCESKHEVSRVIRKARDVKFTAKCRSISISFDKIPRQIIKPLVTQSEQVYIQLSTGSNHNKLNALYLSIDH